MLQFFRKKENILSDLGPLYHDYSFFGVNNEQIPGIFVANQKCKFPILLAYFAHAVAKAKKNSADEVSFTELFCADGFYAMVAAKIGCTMSIGIDSNRDNYFSCSQEIAKRLNLVNVTFLEREITPVSTFEPTDIVANIGGLYHVPDPRGVLEMSYAMARKYLIVQNVVSLANTDENYFESPAPGWDWGNRYSRESFARLIKDLDYRVLDSHFNILEGNDRPEDWGSVYYLIEKTT